MLVDFFDPSAPPRVLHFSGDNQTLVAILDGSGSWGNGVEAAAFARQELPRRLSERQRWTLIDVVDAFSDVLSQTPETLRQADFGWSYAFVALLFDAQTVFCALAGDYQVGLIRAGSAKALFRPRLLGEHLAETGELTANHASSSEHRNICLERFAGENAKPNLTTFQERMRTGDCLVVAKATRLPAPCFEHPPCSAQAAARMSSLADPGVVVVVNL